MSWPNYWSGSPRSCPDPGQRGLPRFSSTLLLTSRVITYGQIALVGGDLSTELGPGIRTLLAPRLAVRRSSAQQLADRTQSIGVRRVVVATILVCVAVVAQCTAAAEPPLPLPRPQTTTSTAQLGPFLVRDDAPQDIILNGPIEDDAPSQFLRVLRARPEARRLLLSSDGGRVDPALLLAKEIHARKLDTYIAADAGCYSACAFLFFAGAKRTVAPGGALGVHQVYGSPDPASVQITFSDVFDQLREFDVPDQVISLMLRTPPEAMHVFTSEELASLGVLEPAPPPANQQAAVETPPTARTQSLLLEASDDARTGAIPTSGSVTWGAELDEGGLPRLTAKAAFPARDLSVDLLMSRNSDPESALTFELTFHTPDDFEGGSVAGLPGILLKAEELVQGEPLAGWSERVSAGKFRMTLSPVDPDRSANERLLRSRRWMDLAVVYATGRRAIITLERDDTALHQIADALDTWSASRAVGGSTAVPMTHGATERFERVIVLEGDLKSTLLDNGIDEQVYSMIEATLSNVLLSAHMPPGALVRILMGPARNEQTLIPYRLSIYLADPKSGSLRHAATAALTDRGNYVLGLEPSPLPGLPGGANGPPVVLGNSTNWLKLDRDRPPG